MRLPRLPRRARARAARDTPPDSPEAAELRRLCDELLSCIIGRYIDKASFDAALVSMLKLIMDNGLSFSRDGKEVVLLTNCVIDLMADELKGLWKGKAKDKTEGIKNDRKIHEEFLSSFDNKDRDKIPSLYIYVAVLFLIFSDYKCKQMYRKRSYPSLDIFVTMYKYFTEHNRSVKFPPVGKFSIPEFTYGGIKFMENIKADSLFSALLQITKISIMCLENEEICGKSEGNISIQDIIFGVCMICVDILCIISNSPSTLFLIFQNEVLEEKILTTPMIFYILETAFYVPKKL